MINRKTRILATDYGSANGNRTRILALKGTMQGTGKSLSKNKIEEYLHYRLAKLHCAWDTPLHGQCSTDSCGQRQTQEGRGVDWMPVFKERRRGESTLQIPVFCVLPKWRPEVRQHKDE